MPVFRFTLAPLLRLRLHAEDQCKRDLGEAMRRRDEAEEFLRRLHKESDDLVAEAAQRVNVFDPAARRQLGLYLQALADRMVSARAARIACDQAVQAATEALRLAVQQRKILERLREIRQEEHRLADNKHKQKALDEYAAHFLRREKEARIHALEP